MSAAATRGAGAELSRDMYSVLRSHETFAAMGGVPPPGPWCRPKSSALPAGSSSSAWSFGSSSGGFCGSGFRAAKRGERKHGRRLREEGGGRCFKRLAYRGHPRRLPRAPPISRGREACRTQRLLPWGAMPRSWRHRETRVGCSVLGW
jgi:hypothetical protein